eukprot:15419086-Alexandrium_andersonii.AAC.1
MGRRVQFFRPPLVPFPPRSDRGPGGLAAVLPGVGDEQSAAVDPGGRADGGGVPECGGAAEASKAREAHQRRVDRQRPAG